MQHCWAGPGRAVGFSAMPVEYGQYVVTRTPGGGCENGKEKAVRIVSALYFNLSMTVSDTMLTRTFAYFQVSARNLLRTRFRGPSFSKCYLWCHAMSLATLSPSSLCGPEG